MIEVSTAELRSGVTQQHINKFDISFLRRSYMEYTNSQVLSQKIISTNNLINIFNHITWMPNIHDIVVERMYAVQSRQFNEPEIEDYYPKQNNLLPIPVVQACVKMLETDLAKPTLDTVTIAKYFSNNPKTAITNRECLLDSNNVMIWNYSYRIGCEKTNRTWLSDNAKMYDMINTNLMIGDNEYKMAKLQNDNYGNTNRLLIRGMIANGMNNPPKAFNPSVFIIKAYKILDDLSVNVNSYAGFNSHNRFSILPDRTDLEYPLQPLPQWVEQQTISVNWTDLSNLRALLTENYALLDNWYIFPIPMSFMRDTDLLGILIYLIVPSWISGATSRYRKGIQYEHNVGNNTFDTHAFYLEMTKTANRCIIDGPQKIMLVVYDYDTVPNDEAVPVTLVDGGEDIPYINESDAIVDNNILADLRQMYEQFEFNTVKDMIHKVLNTIGLDFFETDFKTYVQISSRIAYAAQKATVDNLNAIPDAMVPAINLLLQPVHYPNAGIDGVFEYPSWKQTMAFYLNDLMLYSENYIIFQNESGFLNLKFVFQTMMAASIQKVVNNNCLTLSDIINGSSAQFNERYKMVADAIINKYGPSHYTMYGLKVNYMCTTGQKNRLTYTVMEDRMQYSLRIYLDVLEWINVVFFKNDETKGSQGVDSAQNFLKFTDVPNASQNYVSYRNTSCLNLQIPNLKDVENKFNSYIFPDYYMDNEIGIIRYDVAKSRVAINTVAANEVEWYLIPIIKVDALNLVNMNSENTIDLHFGVTANTLRLRLQINPFLVFSKMARMNLTLISDQRIMSYPNNRIIIKEVNDSYNINDEEYVQQGDIIKVDLSDV